MQLNLGGVAGDGIIIPTTGRNQFLKLLTAISAFLRMAVYINFLLELDVTNSGINHRFRNDAEKPVAGC